MLRSCLFVIILICTAIRVSGRIECYQCSSNSADECGAKFNAGSAKKIFCEGSDPMCSIRVQSRQPYTDLTQRGCASSSLCTGGEFSFCNTCNENLCNGAAYNGSMAGMVISVVLMFTWLYF